jgi:hypothetical protein
MENTEYNKYDKSILAGTEATIAEYQLKSTYEDVTADTITVVFTGNVTDRVSDVVLTYGDTVVSDPLFS